MSIIDCNGKLREKIKQEECDSTCTKLAVTKKNHPMFALFNCLSYNPSAWGFAIEQNTIPVRMLKN